MARKGNNSIPNSHFHKKWQIHVKTWFNQPARKYRRRMARKKKAMRLTPRPIKMLRPSVRCPTVRYQSKLRLGRGFTLEEIKRAGLCPKFARTIGIPVDHRRLNKAYESLAMNVCILKEYLYRLILFPTSNKKGSRAVQFKKVASDEEQNLAVQLTTKSIISPKEIKLRCKSQIISDEERKFSAYGALREARMDVLLQGKRAKKKQDALESLEAITSTKEKRKPEKN